MSSKRVNRLAADYANWRRTHAYTLAALRQLASPPLHRLYSISTGYWQCFRSSFGAAVTLRL